MNNYDQKMLQYLLKLTIVFYYNICSVTMFIEWHEDFSTVRGFKYK